MRRFLAAVSAVIVAFASASVAAEPSTGFPNQPVKLLVGYAAGGSVDIVAPSYARRLSELLGASVVIENRGGAGGGVAAQAVARSAPNGYTLYFAASPTFTILPAIQKAGFDPGSDFQPVGVVANYTNVLMVAADSPYRSVADLVAAAKANRGALSYGSAGNGASNHFSGLMLSEFAGVELLHVPFKGNAPAISEVMAGRLTMLFDLSSTAISQIKGGRLRALAVTSRERNPAFPDVPTMIESGYKDFEFSGWLGVLAPAGLPPGVLSRLVDANRRIVADPAFRAEMLDSGYEMARATEDAMPQRIVREGRMFTAMAKRLNVKLD